MLAPVQPSTDSMGVSKLCKQVHSFDCKQGQSKAMDETRQWLLTCKQMLYHTVLVL